MSNMSYCRFENTLGNLRDCSEHMSDDTKHMSEYEKVGRKGLFEMITTMAEKIAGMDEEELESGHPGEGLDPDED